MLCNPLFSIAVDLHSQPQFGGIGLSLNGISISATCNASGILFYIIRCNYWGGFTNTNTIDFFFQFLFHTNVLRTGVTNAQKLQVSNYEATWLTLCCPLAIALAFPFSYSKFILGQKSCNELCCLHLNSRFKHLKRKELLTNLNCLFLKLMLIRKMFVNTC